MFAQQLNQIRIDLSLTPKGPLLIRSGRAGADPSRPSLECVRTSIAGEPSVFIPGSSLKGVLRSHAEKLLLSEDVTIVGTFDEKSVHAFEQKDPGVATYSGSSPLGRTFGNLHVKGHVAVSDHLPGAHEEPGSAAWQEQMRKANAVEGRDGVAIDRLLGSAKHGALFNQEVVVGGRFDGWIVLRNVQLYQLALLLFAIDDLNAGFLQLGSSTTRGNGWVSAEVRTLTLETRAAPGEARRLRGVGSCAGLEGYRLFGGDEVALPENAKVETRLFWQRVTVPGASVAALTQALFDGPWQSFVGEARGQQWAA